MRAASVSEMPTYDYRCPAGHDFERFFRKISDSVVELECPTCGQIAARRVSGGAGLVFKGSGFYLTDYGKNAHRSGSSPAKASEGKAEGGSGESKGEGAPAQGGGDAKSSESKGESKAEGKAESKAESKPASQPAPKKSSGDA